MDVEDIRPGQNFASTIEQVMAQCSTVLVVIGPRWRELLDARAVRSDEDYVVHEIAAALRSDKRVIPVLVGGASISCMDKLPSALSDLSLHQAVELRDSSFNDDCNRLLKNLRQSHLVPVDLKKLVFWVVSAIIVGLLILVSARAGLGPWHSSHERRAQIEQMLRTARSQLTEAEYESAFASYGAVVRLDPSNKVAQKERLDAAMRWLETFHVLASEGQKAQEIASPKLTELIGVLETGLAQTTGKGARAADIVAHVGWAHYLNEKIAFREFGNAERYFRQSLAIDPTNVYANAFLGNWLLQTGGNTAQALSHFRTALETKQERSLVRSMQLGGLYHNDAIGLRGELVKVLNEMRIGREPLDKRFQEGLSYLYSPTVSSASELHEVFTALPFDDAWKTYLWINADNTGGSAAERDFVHANLTEISGDQVKALAEFKAVAVALRAQQLNGRIADYTAAAIKRLSKPAA